MKSSRYGMRMFLLAFGVLWAAAPAARAQETRREGFWIGGGLGPGWNTSEGLDDDRRGGLAGYLRLGGTPSEKVLLGAEFIAWGREDGDITTTRGNATFSVFFYPRRTGNLFVKAGVGGSSVEWKRDAVSVTENGFGLTVGGGLDIRLSRKLSLTPNADFLFQAFDAGENLQSTNTLFLLTLGLTFH